MKTKIGLFIVFTLFFASISFSAEDVTTVEAANSEISDNLDLELVASIFGEAEDLEDFEKRLNDPDAQISNLDLNEDGEVDYLRVIETSKGDTHLITIQAVIAKDQYQDVATIDVEKGSNGETEVQVVGDVYMYGHGHIITPVYVHPPTIYIWFWSPFYSPWHSPFFWGVYPPYYHPWHPYPRNRYRRNVEVNINVNNTYNHTSIRNSKTSIELQDRSRRNDFGDRNPEKSFSNRNEGVRNKSVLDNSPQRAPTSKVETPKAKAAEKSTGRLVQDDWKPKSERTGNKSKVKDNRVSTPLRSKNNAFKNAGNGNQTRRNAARGSSSRGSAAGRRSGGGRARR